MSDSVKKPYTRFESRPVDSNGNWLHDKAPGAPNSKVTSVPTNKLLVSNLHYEITPKDLTAIFGQIGTLIREPLIRYDRSGRSSGIAIISFETVEEATKAKKQFDGILAKGEPISIVYDNGPPRRPKGTSSLLNRIQKPPLLDRLSKGDLLAKRGRESSTGTGPIRNIRQATRPVRRLQKPQTAEDLDKELDAFMGDSTKSPDSQTTAAAGAGDVEMK